MEKMDTQIIQPATVNAKVVNASPGTLKAHFEVKVVARQLGMCERWIKDRVKSGELEGYRLGAKTVIPEDSLANFMAQRRVTGPAPGRTYANLRRGPSN